MEGRRTTGGGPRPIEPQRTIPVIVGPTASGKTALSLALAERLGDVEIVSADSRLVYIGLDIGTAKPTREERARVPHHMIDLVTPDTLYSAGVYADDASEVIDDVLGRARRPIVVGGSGFYLRALFEGLGAPAVDQVVLARLIEREREEGCDALYRELLDVDPVAAAMHSPNNCVKTMRALACYQQTGRPYSSFLEDAHAGRYAPRYIGIAPSREELYRRINARVHEMVEDGLVEEVRRLLEAGYVSTDPGMKTVGYAEMIEHLEGRMSLEEAIREIQQSTRRYAKRQMTWFRRVDGVEWMESPDVDRAMRVVGE